MCDSFLHTKPFCHVRSRLRALGYPRWKFVCTFEHGLLYAEFYNLSTGMSLKSRHLPEHCRKNENTCRPFVYTSNTCRWPGYFCITLFYELVSYAPYISARDATAHTRIHDPYLSLEIAVIKNCWFHTRTRSLVCASFQISIV